MKPEELQLLRAKATAWDSVIAHLVEHPCDRALWWVVEGIDRAMEWDEPEREETAGTPPNTPDREHSEKKTRRT